MTTSDASALFRRLSRGALPLLLCLVLQPGPTLSGAGPASAQDDSGSTPTKTINVELILHASGSMAQELSTGETRIEAAKRVLRDVIDAVPEREGVNVGFRVYGHEGANDLPPVFGPGIMRVRPTRAA